MSKLEVRTRKIRRILQLKTRIRPTEDFTYVVKQPEKSKVCFGSGLERDTVLTGGKSLVSKFARQNMHKTFTDIGPGTYGCIPQTTAMYHLANKPTSKEGTVLGGRKEQRHSSGTNNGHLIPGPGTYDIKTFLPQRWKQDKVPFNADVARRHQKTSDTPGVGTYVLAPYKHRTIAMKHTFGGMKTLLSAVQMRCGPFNYDICERCRKKPTGDYWKMALVCAKKPKTTKKVDANEIEPEGVFLCRKCHEWEKQHHTMYNRTQLQAFQKFRDCSQFHFHDGCEAKLYLWELVDMKRLKYREGYLQLYFP